MRHNEERSKAMQLNKLKAKIVELGMNVETLAEKIGMERSTLYRKLNNFEKITIGEAVRMKDALGMTDTEASDIFLS
jgi:plasmid maintenance system antidote protein VapI